jgi:hypothetical protein
VPKALDILNRAGVGNPPRKDDIGLQKKRMLRSRTARKADQTKP